VARRSARRMAGANCASTVAAPSQLLEAARSIVSHMAAAGRCQYRILLVDIRISPPTLNTPSEGVAE
jgi:hypothetical protein